VEWGSVRSSRAIHIHVAGCTVHKSWQYFIECNRNATHRSSPDVFRVQVMRNCVHILRGLRSHLLWCAVKKSRHSTEIHPTIPYTLDLPLVGLFLPFSSSPTLTFVMQPEFTWIAAYIFLTTHNLASRDEHLNSVSARTSKFRFGESCWSPW
jgi:hypothetical protein